LILFCHHVLLHFVAAKVRQKNENAKRFPLFLGKARRQEDKNTGRQEYRKTRIQEGKKAGRQEYRKTGRQEDGKTGRFSEKCFFLENMLRTMQDGRNKKKKVYYL